VAQAIVSRDYFEAPGHAEAAEAIEACGKALESFEADAMERELPTVDEPRRRRRSLRSVGDAG
jgi:hypothetical protein